MNKTDTLYQVCNIQDVCWHDPVLRWLNERGEDWRWFEDDLFTVPEGLQASVVDEWIRRGFLEVIRG